MKFYNTLTKSIEEFKPRDLKYVTVYSCGPTVYDYAHIGNFRTYVLTDLLVRSLKYFGYTVKFVTNITDVGHLTSDGDTGEDKLEKGARREGKTAWDVAKFFSDAFIADSTMLNLLSPDVRPKPTEHIPEQIAMVQTLLDKGYGYQIDDGIYFDTSKFADYGALTGQDIEQMKAGARVEVNPQKRNPHDFALWKFSPKNGGKRDMEWESPWGMGFPGWHIECSVMAKKHLGEQIDIHAGGSDLIPVHHTNEIAQSEAASGKKPFSQMWVHGQFIMVDGEKMSKSKGNFYRLADVTAKGYDPLVLRYFYMTAHYRQFLNFTWDGMKSAAKALSELRGQVAVLREQAKGRNVLSNEKLEKVDTFRHNFDDVLLNDLNLPQAIAAVWAVLKSNIPSEDKLELVEDFDQVLGLKLSENIPVMDQTIPEDILELAKKRDAARKNKDFSASDKIRADIEALGFVVEDSSTGTKVRKPL